MQQKKLDNYLYSLMPQKMQRGGRPKKPAKRIFFAIAPERISDEINLVDNRGRVLDKYDESLQGESFRSLRREISDILNSAGDSIFSRPEFNDYLNRYEKEDHAKKAFIRYLSDDIAGVISDNADITFGNLDENSPKNDEERASYTGRLQTPIQDVLNQVKNEYGVDISSVKDLNKLYSGMTGYKYLQKNTYNPNYKTNIKQVRTLDPTFIEESKQASKISMATEGVPSEVIVLSSKEDFREKLPQILKQNKGKNTEFGIFTHAGNFLGVPQDEVNSLISQNIDEACKLGLYSCYGLSQAKDTFKDVKNITHNIGNPWTGVPRFRTQAEYDALRGRSFADIMYSLNPEGKYSTAKPGRDYIDTSLIKEGEREKIYEGLRVRRAEEMALRDLRRAARNAGETPPTRLPQGFDLSAYLGEFVNSANASSFPSLDQWASERGYGIDDDTRAGYWEDLIGSGLLPTFDQWLSSAGRNYQNASLEELRNFYDQDLASIIEEGGYSLTQQPSQPNQPNQNQPTNQRTGMVVPTFEQWLNFVGDMIREEQPGVTREELQEYYQEDLNNAQSAPLTPMQEPLPQLQPRMPVLRSTRGGARNGGLQKLQGGGFPNINIPNLSIGSIFGAYGQAGTQYGNLFNFPAGDNPFKPKTVNTKSWLDLSGVEQQTKKVEIAKELNLTSSGGSWKDPSGQTYENDQLLKMAEEKYNSQRTNTEEYNKMLPFGQLAYGSMNLQDMVSQELKNKKEKIQDFPVMKSTYAPKGFAEQGGRILKTRGAIKAQNGLKTGTEVKQIDKNELYVTEEEYRDFLKKGKLPKGMTWAQFQELPLDKQRSYRSKDSYIVGQPQVKKQPAKQNAPYIPPIGSSIIKLQVTDDDAKEKAISKQRYNEVKTNEEAGKILKSKKPKDYTPQEAKIIEQATNISDKNKYLDPYKISVSDEAKQKDAFSSTKNFAEVTGALGPKLSLQRLPVVGQYIPDFLDVTRGIGDMASGLGSVPYDIQQGNYGQAALNIGLPVLTGGLAGIGARTTGQFANSLLNPFEGLGDVAKNITKIKPLVKPSSVESGLIETVDNLPSSTWQFEKIPGLHLGSTITGSPLEKQISKTGNINVDKIKEYVGRQEVGQQDKFFIQKVLDEKFPGQTKINYNDFRKEVSKELVPLIRRRLDKNSFQDFGLEPIGYKSGPQKGYESILNSSKRAIDELENKLKGKIRSKSGRTAEEVRADLQNELVSRKKQYDELLKSLNDYPLDKGVVVYENPSQFGVGSSAHFDESTLGHARTLVSKEEPDVMHILEQQSDAWQKKQEPKSVNLEEYIQRLSNLENEYKSGLADLNKLKETRVDSSGLPVSDSQLLDYAHALVVQEKNIKFLKERIKLFKGDLANPDQKKFLGKNFLERFLQENLLYAAQQGKSKVRYPTPETTVKIQGYKPELDTRSEYIKYYEDVLEMVENQEEFMSRNGAFSIDQLSPRDRAIIKEYNENPEKFVRNIQNKIKELENLKSKYGDNTYTEQRQRVLKNYGEDIPKTFKRLFGEEAKLVTDSKGNTWYEFDIPESFKEGTAEIKAFQQGGAINYLQQLMGYKDNSPYKNLPYQDIFSNRITMKGVSQPLLATTDNGISTIMQPGVEYYFPGASVVREKRIDAPPVPTPDKDLSGRRILRKMQDGGKIKTFSNDPEWFNSQTFDNWTIKQLRTGKYGVDPESGALYKLKKPVKVPQEFLDLTSENPSDTETARRGAAFSGLQTAYQNPAMQAPGIIGLGGAMAPTALRVLNTPIALGRFTNAALTPQKVLSAVGAGLAPFNAAEGVKNIQEGNYAEGAADLALAGLDLYVPELLGPAGAINKALKSSMRTLPNIEELRRIFHNQERILSEDELIKLTQEGRGVARDYIDPSYRVDLLNPEQANIWDTNLDGLRRIRTQQLFSTPSANLKSKAGDAVRNKSKLTKKDVLDYVNPKDKGKVSRMTDEEFSDTVLKPSGEVVPYYKGDLDKLKENITSISKDEFVNEFNRNIDRLNAIIRGRNRTGIEYKVKELTPDGKLIFETPPQPISSSTLAEDEEALRIFESDPVAFLVERGGLRQTDSGNWVLDNLDPLVEFQNLEDVVSTARSEINKALAPAQIGGTSYWDVDIKPGRFTGDVEDIASTEYLRDYLPGLNMAVTSKTVFSDGVARDGSGAYQSINDYLKELGLGRVKSGFNVQTDSSKSVWENFLNTDRGVGFYGGPGLVYGALKNWLPGGIALGALMGTQENQEDGEVQNKKQGGMILSKKRKTPPVPTPDNMFIMKNGGTMYANNLPNAKIGKKIGNFFSDLGRGWLDTLGNVTGGWDLDDSKYKTNIAKSVASVTNPISKISGSLTRSIGEAVLPGSGAAAGQMWKSVGSSMPTQQTPTYTPAAQTQQNPLSNLNFLLGIAGPTIMTGSIPNMNSFMPNPQMFGGMFQQGGELDAQQMQQTENSLMELPMEQQVELYKGLIDFVVENGIEELASQHPQEYEFFEMFNDYLDDLDEEEEEVQEEEPMSPEEMANGGIPQRYKNLGFSKVGQKRQSTRPGKKWMVLAKKGDQYKVVHGGAKGMSDFTKHKNEKRRNRFWDRMGGKSSAKATDPFSPLYWHKRFKTW